MTITCHIFIRHYFGATTLFNFTHSKSFEINQQDKKCFVSCAHHTQVSPKTPKGPFQFPNVKSFKNWSSPKCNSNRVLIFTPNQHPTVHVIATTWSSGIWNPCGIFKAPTICTFPTQRTHWCKFSDNNKQTKKFTPNFRE